jgi:hypothetical protein
LTQDRDIRPTARTDGLVVQELGDESLVYDRERDVAHCLSSIAARVWRNCDGSHDLVEIADLTAESPDLVDDALDELYDKGLLLAPSAPKGGASAVSRRHAIGRIAKIGASAAAAPLIISAIAASPASAASVLPLGAPCPAAGDTCVSTLVCANFQGSGLFLCLIPSGGPCDVNNVCASNVCVGGPGGTCQ